MRRIATTRTARKHSKVGSRSSDKPERGSPRVRRTQRGQRRQRDRRRLLDSRIDSGPVVDAEAQLHSIPLPALEPRLQRRYLRLVQSHLRSATKLAPGVAPLLISASNDDSEQATAGETLPAPYVTAGAAAQAAWRFLKNTRIELAALVEPLRDVGRERVKHLKSRFALCVHDWCKLGFDYPKTDMVQLTHESDVGYDLTMALLVSADDGSPLAPMEMHLKTGDGILSTRESAPEESPHTDQVLATMEAGRCWRLEKPLLHVIDREADSVDHYRRWDAAGHRFLVRADDRSVIWSSEPWHLEKIVPVLERRRNAFRLVDKDALYQGKRAQLWVAETRVTLTRPAKKSVKGKKFELPGRPLDLRYVMVQLRDDKSRVLAKWMLLTNAPARATSDHLARCYYWRWRIESYFKLLKSHGHHLEQWQQRTAAAIARRLLVASMACVVVWQLMADSSPEATELKDLLVRLSGRQTKRRSPHTAPALLAGLWVLLSMLDLIKLYDLKHIRGLAARIPWISTA